MGRLRGRKGQAARAAARALSVLLCAAALPAGCADKQPACSIEAGDDLPNPYRLIGAEGAAYVAGFDESCARRPGTYAIPMTDASGKRYTLTLTVRDRRAPVVTTRLVYYPKDVGVPRAEDFIASIEEADEYTAAFTCDLPDMTEIGDFDVSFRVRDRSGNRTGELRSVLTVIEDREPPVFETLPEISAYVGEAIAYRKGLIVTDNCGGAVRVEVDASAVDPLRAGDYPVRFSATDLSGNRASAETVLHLYEARVTEAQLLERLAGLADSLTTPDMTREGKLRAVYRYLNTERHISYVADAPAGDWVRAAYDSLFVTGVGDCFSYMAAAKAFCRYFGIEFYEIERERGAADGTHFWLLVNIGSPEQPRLYHFDCTRLRTAGEYCLLTDRQIRAYNRVRAGFYAYDRDRYPPSAEEIITRTPELEPYY